MASSARQRLTRKLRLKPCQATSSQQPVATHTPLASSKAICTGPVCSTGAITASAAATRSAQGVPIGSGPRAGHRFSTIRPKLCSSLNCRPWPNTKAPKHRPSHSPEAM